jgi:hypothetical protein
VSLITTWVFYLASSISRVCVGVRVPWFVCDTCVSQVLIAVKCAVAGSLIATGADLLQGFMLCVHPGKWLCG